MRLADGGGRESAAGGRAVSCSAVDGGAGRGDPKREACRRGWEAELVLNALLVVMPVVAADPDDAEAGADTGASLAPLLAAELVAGASGQVRVSLSCRKCACGE